MGILFGWPGKKPKVELPPLYAELCEEVPTGSEIVHCGVKMTVMSYQPPFYELSCFHDEWLYRSALVRLHYKRANGRLCTLDVHEVDFPGLLEEQRRAHQ